MALSWSVVELVEAVGVYPIVDRTRFDSATLLVAWNSMKCVVWTVASSVSTSQLLPFVMQTCTFLGFPQEGSAPAMQPGKNDSVPRSLLHEVLFSIPMLPWYLLRREVDEFVHQEHKVLLSQYVPNFLVFVPYSLMGCTSAAVILSAEPLTGAASFHPASGMPTSEAPYHHTVSASLLSARHVIRRGHPNFTSPCLLISAPGIHLDGGVDSTLSNSLGQPATHRTGIATLFSGVISDAFPELHSQMAGNVLVCVPGSSLSSVPVSSTSVQTSLAATAPF